MGLFGYDRTKDDYFITIDGKPFTDFHPNDVAKMIASLPTEQRELVVAMVKQKPIDMYEEMTGVDLPDNYAEHVGRPNLKEVPYGSSENDGYPFLPGHDPLCNGKEYHNGMCKCKYDKWNHPNGEVNRFHTEMWPGGPCIDDFDM